MNIKGIKSRIEKLKPFAPHDPITEIHRVIFKPHRDTEDRLTAAETGEVVVYKIKPWWTTQ